MADSAEGAATGYVSCVGEGMPLRGRGVGGWEHAPGD